MCVFWPMDTNDGWHEREENDAMMIMNPMAIEGGGGFEK